MKSRVSLAQPADWAAAAITSSAGSGLITPSLGLRIQEEQDVMTTPGPTRRSTSRAGADALSTPASSPSEPGSILTASDDDTRPADKRELKLLRFDVKAYAKRQHAVDAAAVSDVPKACP